MAPRPARLTSPGRYVARRCHRHGFASLINGADASRPCRPTRLFLFLVCCLGLPAGGRLCNQRTIDSCGPTLVCLRAVCAGLFRANFRTGRSFDRWDHGFAGGGCTAASSVREVEFLEMEHSFEQANVGRRSRNRNTSPICRSRQFDPGVHRMR